MLGRTCRRILRSALIVRIALISYRFAAAAPRLVSAEKHAQARGAARSRASTRVRSRTLKHKHIRAEPHANLHAHPL